jgi:hypothetical protein
MMNSDTLTRIHTSAFRVWTGNLTQPGVSCKLILVRIDPFADLQSGIVIYMCEKQRSYCQTRVYCEPDLDYVYIHKYTTTTHTLES